MPFPHHVRFAEFTFYRYPQWGDVYWYDFGVSRAEQHTMAEPHLAIVVSNTAITLRGTVLVVPLSGAEHVRTGYGFHVRVARSECPALDKDSIAKVDQIYCVPTRPGLPDQYHLTRLNGRVMKRLYDPLLKALAVDVVLGM